MEKEYVSPLKSIRKHCVQCVGSWKDVESCGGENSCPLYDYRFGKNPFRAKRVLSDDQKREMAERLSRSRESK